MIDIDSLILESRKSRDSNSLKAYQNIKVEIQKNQTAKGTKPLTDELQLQIIAKYAKTLEDSISQFLAANREDLVSEYRSELEVVQKLLPKPVTKQQIISIINEWGNINGHFPSEEVVIHLPEDILFKVSKKEMGTIIKFVKSKFPTADGKMISEIVKKYIT